MTAYYNEIEPYAVEWLRNLIKAGLIAPGDVDDRSIVEVQPEDLKGYTQCHFFAGIGIWSHALRQAGWHDDRQVWSGSCPCQPFSVAGRKGGTKDERHLWPEFYRLIRQCKPDAIFGEQVASKDGLAWLDTVSTDLENSGYAIGACSSPAAGYGAPHQRQRMYFVAESEGERRRKEREEFFRGGGGGGEERLEQRSERGGNGVLDVTVSERCNGINTLLRAEGGRGGGETTLLETPRAGGVSVLGDAGGERGGRDTRAISGSQTGAQRSRGITDGGVSDESIAASADDVLGNAGSAGSQVRSITNDGRRIVRIEGQAAAAAGVVGGFWRDADLIWCRDEKYRPIKPGLQCLAHGVTGRVGKLRAIGNGIVAPQAVEFVKAYLDAVSFGDGKEALAQEDRDRARVP